MPFVVDLGFDDVVGQTPAEQGMGKGERWCLDITLDRADGGVYLASS